MMCLFISCRFVTIQISATISCHLQCVCDNHRVKCDKHHRTNLSNVSIGPSSGELSIFMVFPEIESTWEIPSIFSVLVPFRPSWSPVGHKLLFTTDNGLVNIVYLLITKLSIRFKSLTLLLGVLLVTSCLIIDFTVR